MNSYTHELAWAAGFFDGEGSSFAFAPSGSLTCRASIAQVHREPLDRFKEAVGVGVVNGPYVEEKKKTQQPIYRYDANGFERVQHVLCCLWPWLGEVKKEQFIKALTAVRNREKPHRQPPKCGTYVRYCSYACRCDACRSAAREYRILKKNDLRRSNVV